MLIFLKLIISNVRIAVANVFQAFYLYFTYFCCSYISSLLFNNSHDLLVHRMVSCWLLLGVTDPDTSLHNPDVIRWVITWCLHCETRVGCRTHELMQSYVSNERIIQHIRIHISHVDARIGVHFVNLNFIYSDNAIYSTGKITFIILL